MATTALAFASFVAAVFLLAPTALHRLQWRSEHKDSMLTAAHRCVLIALPFLLFMMMLHIQPEYVSSLWTHPLGIKMSLFGLALQILGAIVIKKIVDIKV